MLLLFIVAYGPHGTTQVLREGVDAYNRIGSHARLLGFMKVGASARDQRYLNLQMNQLRRQPLARAYLDGGSIRLSGLPHPLVVLDLDQALFTINGRILDFKKYRSVEARFRAVENLMFPVRRFTWWEWVLPAAVAEVARSSSASIAGVVGTAGMLTATHCLSRSTRASCEDQFMLGAASIGAVGGLSRETPTQVFCSPDFSGGHKFVIAGDRRNLISVGHRHGAYEINSTSEITPAATKAAADLLAKCKDKSNLEALSVALAFTTQTDKPDQATPKTTTTTMNRPPTNNSTSAVMPSRPEVSEPTVTGNASR